MEAYLHPQIFPTETPNFYDVMRSTDPMLAMEGPARCGKSIIGLRKLFALHARYPIRSAIIRAHAVDLQDNIRYDINHLILRYPLGDPRCPIKASGGMRFDHLYFPNGGECVLGGADRPGKVMGSHYDLMFLNEANQIKEESIHMFKTRCSGSHAKWRDSGNIIRFQMLLDLNPDVPGHHLYQMEDDDLIRFIKMEFTDNSRFYRKKRWSDVGKTTINELDQLPGIWHDRYFKGLRVAAQGQVYQIRPENIVDTLPNLAECNLYRACDWGQTHPSICVWIAEDKITGDVTVYREWRKTHSDIDEMPLAIKAYTADEPIKITVVDNDEYKIKEFQKHGIPAQAAHKGAGSVINRIFLIQAALRRAQEGKPGGLYIYKDLVCNNDPNPDIQKKASSLIQEMERLQYSPNGDKPNKEEDDACDALGYWYLWRAKFTGRNFQGKAINKRRTDWLTQGVA